jgi:hypothetical protein
MNNQIVVVTGPAQGSGGAALGLGSGNPMPGAADVADARSAARGGRVIVAGLGIAEQPATITPGSGPGSACRLVTARIRRAG